MHLLDFQAHQNSRHSLPNHEEKNLDKYKGIQRHQNQENSGSENDFQDNDREFQGISLLSLFTLIYCFYIFKWSLKRNSLEVHYLEDKLYLILLKYMNQSLLQVRIFSDKGKKIQTLEMSE